MHRPEQDLVEPAGLLPVKIQPGVQVVPEVLPHLVLPVEMEQCSLPLEVKVDLAAEGVLFVDVAAVEDLAAAAAAKVPHVEQVAAAAARIMPAPIRITWQVCKPETAWWSLPIAVIHVWTTTTMAIPIVMVIVMTTIPI